MKANTTVDSPTGRISISMEEQAKYVKAGSLKKGPTAEVVSGAKRHDLCVWIDDDPVFIVEVKKFKNRYHIFDNDIKRLEAVVKESNAPNYSMVAFCGSRLYGRSTMAKHVMNIERRFPDHTVCIQKFGFQGFSTYNLTGTIVVSK